MMRMATAGAALAALALSGCADPMDGGPGAGGFDAAEIADTADRVTALGIEFAVEVRRRDPEATIDGVWTDSEVEAVIGAADVILARHAWDRLPASVQAAIDGACALSGEIATAADDVAETVCALATPGPSALPAPRPEPPA